MSIFADILQLLGLVRAVPPPVHMLKGWVALPFTMDSSSTSSAPFNFQIPTGSRDIAAFRAFTRHYNPLDFGALQANGLLRPDPGDATKFQVNLTLRIVYPARPGDPNKIAGTAKLPIVLLNHGMHANWKDSGSGGVVVTPSLNGYAYLQDALAQNGIVSISVDHNFACFTQSLIETRADTIIAALDALSAEAASGSSRYNGRLDFSKIGLMGHSRGGDAVVRAVKKILADASLKGKYTVTAVCSLAPTDFTGGDIPTNRMFLDFNDVNFYLVVYGALDGDVLSNGANSFAGTGFRHFDRARPQKAMVFLDNCCHNAFNSVWFADGNDSSDSRLASDSAHKSIAIDYIGDLFRWQLKGENLGVRFDGRRSNSVGQHASLQWLFGQSLKRVDDFENPAANLLGGARSVLNPGGAPTGIEDFASIAIGGSSLELHTAHQTHVLHVDLTQGVPTGSLVLTTDIPGSDQNWSALDTLIFSLSGWFDPTSDATIAAANLPRVTITLLDSNNHSGSLDWNNYGTSLPSRPVFKANPSLGNITLMRLETIPVKLQLFLLSGVDLTKITRVLVAIQPDNGTHVFVDNIHVVKRQ